MKAEERIYNKVGKDAGFRVPEGFFEQKREMILSSLPEREAPAPLHRSRWQRLKPFVYLAAMFAGIWCSLKMVQMISSGAGQDAVSLDNPPALVAQAMTNPEVAEMMMPAATITTADASYIVEEPSTTSTDEADDSPELSEGVLTDPMLPADIDISQLRAELAKDDDEDFLPDYDL